jgi:uncharacterized membrane protein YfcA
MLSPVQIALLTIIAGFGSTLQGAFGYGMALAISPFLLLIEPRLIPGPFTIAATVLVLLMVVREKQSVDFHGLAWAIPGQVGGILFGGWVLTMASQRLLSILFGFLVLGVVLVSLRGLRIPLKKETLLAAGLVSGIMAILTTLSGPPLAIVYQDSPGERLRATLSGFFIFGSIFSLATLLTIGRLGIAEIQLSLALIPGVVIGYLLSNRLLPLVDKGFSRHAILAISAVGAVLVLVRQI